MPTTEMIFPECIRLDGGTQPRAKIDQAVCDDYGERMKAGEKFPAIDVFFDGENYWLMVDVNASPWYCDFLGDQRRF